MSKKPSKMKLQKQEKKEREKFDMLIDDLMSELCIYQEQKYIIVKNDNKGFGDEENQFLNSPHAAYWYIKDSKDYLDREYGETVYINKYGDGMFYEYDGIIYEENLCPEYIYIGYCHKLQERIVELKEQIKKLEMENKRLKGE